LCPLPLVLSLGTTEKSLAPYSWHPLKVSWAQPCADRSNGILEICLPGKEGRSPGFSPGRKIFSWEALGHAPSQMQTQWLERRKHLCFARMLSPSLNYQRGCRRLQRQTDDRNKDFFKCQYFWMVKVAKKRKSPVTKDVQYLAGSNPVLFKITIHLFSKAQPWTVTTVKPHLELMRFWYDQPWLQIWSIKWCSNVSVLTGAKGWNTTGFTARS